MKPALTRMLAQGRDQMHEASELAARANAHHANPGGALDYILVAAGVVIVLLVCIFTVKFLIQPGERNPRHIKSRILRDDF